MGIEVVMPFFPLIITTSATINIEPYLIVAQIEQESGYNPDAIGALGEIGLGQIMLKTARDFAPNITEDQLKEPQVNIAIQCLYLTWISDTLFKRTENKDHRMILAAYNWGIGHILAHVKLGGTFDTLPEQVKGYVNNIYQMSEEIKKDMPNLTTKGEIINV